MSSDIKKHIIILGVLFFGVLLLLFYAILEKNFALMAQSELLYEERLFTHIESHLLKKNIHKIQQDLGIFSVQNRTTNYFKKLKLKFYNSGKSLNQFVKSELYKSFLESYKINFETLFVNHKIIENIFFIDNYGNVLYSAFESEKLGKKLKRPAYKNTLLAKAFRETKKEKRALFVQESTDAIISAPFLDASGIKIGVIALSLKIEEISQQSQSEAQLLLSSSQLKTKESYMQELFEYTLMLYVLTIFIGTLSIYFIIQKFNLSKISESLTKIEKNAQVHNEKVVWKSQEALHRFGGSKEALVNIIPLFIRDTQKQLFSLERAIEAEDFSKIKLYAHTIKGSSSNLGLERLSLLVQTIEITAIAKDIFSIKNSYVQLKKYWEETLVILRAYLKDNEKDSSIHLSTDSILSALNKLKFSLEKGDFIDTKECNVFSANISNKIDIQLQALKNEIDGFEMEKAIQIIDAIIQELKSGS